MKTKLTLTVEEDVVKKAKQMAKRRKTSVSALFEQWSAQNNSETNQSSFGERLRGKWGESDILENPQENTDPRLEALLEKHAG